MAVTWLIPKGKDRLEPIIDKATLLRRFEGQRRVTIATGITCAFLGDERNLREYVVAAEAARVLKRAGHIVSLYLFDDSLDPLTPAQLRVAANKDAPTIEKYLQFCGMPIADIPSPEAGSANWAEHFQKLLLRRLADYDCYPTLESTAHLYESGAYDSFVKLVLERGNEVKRLLDKDFPDYTPQALYYPICPACGHIKGTSLTYFNKTECVVECEGCRMTATIPVQRLRGKLNWKLDCAARWKVFGIDVEPFSKAYLEPAAGAFWIARAVAKELFSHTEVHPLLIGLVKLEGELDSRSLSSLPQHTLRNIYTERWNNDIHLTRERLVLAASKPDFPGEPSYLDKIRRHLPHLKVKSRELLPAEYSFLRKAELFQETVLNVKAESYDGAAATIETLTDSILWGARMMLRDAVHLRRGNSNYEHFDAALKFTSGELGHRKTSVHSAIRELLGHRKGLPLRRLIYTAHLSDLELLLLAIERTLDSRGAVLQIAHERADADLSLDRREPRVTRLS
jgi:hypothetical protein